MSAMDREAHWQNVYITKGEKEVSWFQEKPSKSLELIARCGADPETAIIDVGGGASRLVDELLKAGYRNLTILDLSEAALATSRERIGSRSEEVKWISGDATTWQPSEQYDIWHDRAAFHFLTEAQDRQDYIARLKSALRHGGKVIIGTFALDGPERCSGLPVQRYDANGLAAVLGPDFRLLSHGLEEHRTPWGASQMFQFSSFSFCPR
ncbi:class I SAM-dependent methyltransferase [Bradyrhizobium sp. GCM10028915]|uniref:class I SAM-dependent methyltransferase n=1 Tax=Bradyrhizobium sp. GCM10028915 TaxID=3273385 RepID=UPI00361C9C4B